MTLGYDPFVTNVTLGYDPFVTNVTLGYDPFVTRAEAPRGWSSRAWEAWDRGARSACVW